MTKKLPTKFDTSIEIKAQATAHCSPFLAAQAAHLLTVHKLKSNIRQFDYAGQVGNLSYPRFEEKTPRGL